MFLNEYKKKQFLGMVPHPHKYIKCPGKEKRKMRNK
jgi:hypothetical protein